MLIGTFKLLANYGNSIRVSCSFYRIGSHSPIIVGLTIILRELVKWFSPTVVAPPLKIIMVSVK